MTVLTATVGRDMDNPPTVYLGEREDGDDVVNLLMDVCAAVDAGDGEKPEVEPQKM